MDKKETVLISFSGGRTSAMMTNHLLKTNNGRFDYIVVFANTGHEREATLEFVHKCDVELGFNTVWIECVTNSLHGKGVGAKVVNHETAYRNHLKNGIDPFEAVIAKHGISNQSTPHCSREMKKYTIRAYMRSIGHKQVNYKTYLGIRTDEPKRLDFNKAKKEKIAYMAELGRVTKNDVNKYWAEMPFDLGIKSYEGNCSLCWKKSDRKIFTIIREAMESNNIEILSEISWIRYIEKKYGRFVPESRIHQDKGGKVHFFRNNRSIDDMVNDSMLIETSSFAIDETNLVDDVLQTRLWDSELDSNEGCVESCEAFS